MRAGLLSQPKVIQRINEHFVSATCSYTELGNRAASGDALAQEILRHWGTPLVLVFLSPEGRFITKLSSLTDLTQVHPDTTKRPEAKQYHSLESDVNNASVFLKHVNEHFPAYGGR